MAAQQQQQSIFASTVERFMAHALNTFYCRGALGTWVNLDTIGSVWTGTFDLNTLRVDGANFWIGKKKLRIQKYPDTCGRGLNLGGSSVKAGPGTWPSRWSICWWIPGVQLSKSEGLGDYLVLTPPLSWTWGFECQTILLLAAGACVEAFLLAGGGWWSDHVCPMT